MNNRREVNNYYPMFVNIRGRKCVVVGGGRVALRKVRGLLEYGASIEVISPDPCPELAGLAGKGQISFTRRQYQPGDLENTFIAFAATDNSGINREVVEEARSRAVPVNVADDRENSDFIVPSRLRQGELTIAVSTAGTSPALARNIRIRLEQELGEEYAVLVRLAGEVRDELKERGIEVSGDEWQEALDLDSLIGWLKKDNYEKARAFLLEKLNVRQN